MQPRTAHAAIAKPGANGQSTNVLEVRVAGDTVSYVVNGTVVHTTPKSGAAAAGGKPPMLGSGDPLFTLGEPEVQHPWHRDKLVQWNFGDLPEKFELRRGGVLLTLFPALVDQGAAGAGLIGCCTGVPGATSVSSWAGVVTPPVKVRPWSPSESHGTRESGPPDASGVVGRWIPGSVESSTVLYAEFAALTRVLKT